ncbi:hypothetical protein [Nakamurella sp. PAMC28650]|uniref:hypothetical protein n=1 Tax=Nakamurella sp. PAMC28650 TaxID=2762325 RepID=UPI00164DE8DA|nr:hypothetical protein [Nakamurella sp. PAMC28650]QNK80907.1 hypothetical protein H7F38_22900 [Nakamurella sp. PAMC28650]
MTVYNGQATVDSGAVHRIAAGVAMVAVLLTACTSTAQNSPMALSSTPSLVSSALVATPPTPGSVLSGPTSSSAAETGALSSVVVSTLSAAPQSTQNPPAPTTIGSTAVATVVAQLGSTDPAKMRAALGLPADQPLSAAVASSVAALQPIVVDYPKLVIVRPGVAQVPATTKDRRRWLLTLAYHTRWYLVEADPQ